MSTLNKDSKYFDAFYQYALSQLFIFSSLLNEEEKESIRQAQDPFSKNIAKLFTNVEANEIEEVLTTITCEIESKIIFYTNEFSFEPQKPDPIKIRYWLAYLLYEKDALQSLDILRRMLIYTTGIDIEKVQAFKLSTDIFLKQVRYSKTHTLLEYEKIFGEGGISGYQVYKLMYQIIEDKFPYVNNDEV